MSRITGFDNFERLMFLTFIFGMAGLFIGGWLNLEGAGALIGSLLGIGLGIFVWHKHDWQRQPLYDGNGKEVMMLKTCSMCGVVEFDGWFKQ